MLITALQYSQQERVSNAVSKKQMERAKTLLRLKKGMQDLLAKRQGSLSTLESVWLGVERASGDVEVCPLTFSLRLR